MSYFSSLGLEQICFDKLPNAGSTRHEHRPCAQYFCFPFFPELSNMHQVAATCASYILFSLLLFLIIFPCLLYCPLQPPQAGTAAMLQPLVLFCRCFHLLPACVCSLLSVLPYFRLIFSSFSLATHIIIISLLRSLPLAFRTTMRRN